jgi:transitional endoplasmic reticulum ATPase
MEDKKDEVELKVGELTQREEFGRGIVRIDTKTMQTIGVREGDVVELEGAKKTGATVVRSYPADIHLNIARMDGLVRKNISSGVGDIVKVRKADVKDAKKIVLAPAQEGVIIQISPNIIKQNIIYRPVVKGDIIVPSSIVRGRDKFDRMPSIFQDFFGFDFDDFFTPTGETRFVVTNTDPAGIVRITDMAELEILPTLPKGFELEARAAPSVTYEDIGGMNEATQKVREMIELPLRHPELFTRLGIEPPKGVLLHGPPGCGKTLLAKAVSNESGANFYEIAGPEIMSMWYGKSEENLRKIFEEAEKSAPSIIFIDEIDSIAPKREEVHGEVERRVVSQLLTLMDGLKARGKVIVIAATNIPNIIDPALRRPGRFDREIEIGIPDRKGRKEIFQIHTRRMPIDSWDIKVATDTLRKKINNFEEDSKKKVEEYKTKIETLNSEMVLKQRRLKEATEELKRLEIEKTRYREESILRKILNKITSTRSEIDEIKSSVLELEKEITEIKRNIEKTKKDIEKINKRKEEVNKNKKLLDSIAKEITEIKHLITIRGSKDLRNIFSERRLENINENVKEIIDDLLETGIISNELIGDITKETVMTMLEEMAGTTYGYTGADISALTKEAAMHALRRLLPNIKWKEEEELPAKDLEGLRVTKDDFDYASRVVEPSAMREVLIEIPNIKWSDIGGLEDVKQQLKEAVEWPLKTPESFKRMGITPPKGILLYGPPGCGKTLLAKAVANESGANFILVKGPELFSKWVGESEKKVRELFRRARQVAPSIIFFDEIDAMVPRRGLSYGEQVTEKIVSQMLTELSGLEDLHDVVVLAATNRPDMLDPALLRPGRFDRRILVPSPDEKARLKILEIKTKGMPLKGVNIKKLAKDTEGYSGADLDAVCREAAMFALREDKNAKEVKVKHFEKALKEVKPSLNDTVIEFYKMFDERTKKKLTKEEKPGKDELSYVG